MTEAGGDSVRCASSLPMTLRCMPCLQRLTSTIKGISTSAFMNYSPTRTHSGITVAQLVHNWCIIVRRRSLCFLFTLWGCVCASGMTRSLTSESCWCLHHLFQGDQRQRRVCVVVLGIAEVLCGGVLILYHLDPIYPMRYLEFVHLVSVCGFQGWL